MFLTIFTHRQRSKVIVDRSAAKQAERVSMDETIDTLNPKP